MRTVGWRLNTGATTRPRHVQPSVAAATVLCAASMLALGVWGFGWPASFARFIDYAPYNRHLIHDAGAFQIGIGIATLLALCWSDSLLVALTGFAVASGLHTVSHVVDRDIGGHAGDVPELGTLTLVALYAIVVRLHRSTQERPGGRRRRGSAWSRSRPAVLPTADRQAAPHSGQEGRA